MQQQQPHPCLRHANITKDILHKLPISRTGGLNFESAMKNPCQARGNRDGSGKTIIPLLDNGSSGAKFKSFCDAKVRACVMLSL